MQDDASHGERNLDCGRLEGVPAGEVLHVLGSGGEAVAVTKDRFENKAEGDGEVRKVELKDAAKLRKALKVKRLLGGGEELAGLVTEVSHTGRG